MTLLSGRVIIYDEGRYNITPEAEEKLLKSQQDAENAAKEPAQVLPSPLDNAGAEDIDYKKLYEEEAEKVKQLQKQNIMQDASAGNK